jgi:hypothetical protein
MIPCGGFTTPMRQLPLSIAITRGRLFLNECKNNVRGL